jgi:hypothetical protein
LKPFHFLLFLAVFAFDLNGNASQVKKMNQHKFDYFSYGLLHENELSIKLHLWQGANAPALSLKPKPAPQTGLQPKIEPPPEAKEKNNNAKVISASLEFTNISTHEVHVMSRLWYTRLKVFANGNKADYIGPMVSLAPPNKNDFESVKPGDKFATEPVKLNGYFKLPDDFTGTLKVTLEFSPQVPVAEAILSVN